MTLFSTLIQFNILLLFIFLGLASGTAFNIFKTAFTFLNKIFNKNLKLKQEFLNNLLTANPSKNKLRKLKFKKKYLVFIKNFLTIFFNFILIIIFISTIIVSFLINLKYNFGCLSFYYILIWILFFYLGYTFIKIVANFIISFYNSLNKRLKKDER